MIGSAFCDFHVLSPAQEQMHLISWMLKMNWKRWHHSLPTQLQERVMLMQQKEAHA